jgi:L-rhamnose-H+ transport protein
VFNFVFALLAVPELPSVYRSVGAEGLALPLVFGIIWGIGAIGFGLGVTAAGFSLGYAVLLGTVLGMGAFIPMIVLHPGDILTPTGLVVLAGLGVTLAGIGASGRAGILREREQGGSAGEITRISRFSQRTGILICFAAGICSSTINIGFSLCGNVTEAALAHGASPLWAGNAIWALLFTSGGTLNIAYCLYLLAKNGTAGRFFSAGWLGNAGLLALMSLMWIGSFILYGVGATMMGPWGTVIGWSVYMTLSIAVANLWGIMQGEWKGSSGRSRRTMAWGFALIFLAILVFAYGGSM